MKVFKNINYGELEQQRLDLYIPDSENFTVFVFFHGGGLEGGDKSEIEIAVPYLVDRDIAVVSANYRLYPEAKYPEFICDAAAAVAWAMENIHEYGKCDKFIVGGSSAGAYLSMMLCFDKRYLSAHNIDLSKIAGFIHNAGQPTCHFNVLRERGLDTRRVIVDESAPLYHIGVEKCYPPMLFIVSDNDMENRYEQTMLAISTLKHFGADSSKVQLKVMHGGHCEHVFALDDDSESVFGKLIHEFISRL